jgi:hypothetical protein
MHVCTRLTLRGVFVKTRFVAGSNKAAIYIALFVGIAAVGVRLVAISQPFIDNWSWRESDVAAIARNFSEHGFHFAYPQIDWAGDAAGYVGTEFPILPFAVALIYKIAGVQEWIGRLETVLFFAGSLPFFYFLVRGIFGETVALWSLVFYGFAPLNIAASRAFMPDVPSLSLSLAGLYFFLRWLEDNEWRSLVGASVAISLALLIKLPSAVLGAPLLYLGWQRFGISLFKQPKLCLFGAIAFLPASAWYWHAHEIAEAYYPYHFFGGGGFRIMSASWYWSIATKTASSSLTPVLFVLALGGVFIVPPGKYSRMFHWWLAAMILFIYVVGWGNRHQWYQLPLVPIAAVFAGCACQSGAVALAAQRILRVALAVIFLAAFGPWSYANVQRFYAPDAAGLRNLGLELNAIIPPNALVIAADDGDPTIFYYAQRKGWHFLEDGIYEGNPPDSAEAIADLEKLRSHGANYLVFYAGTLWWLDYYKEFAARLRETAELIEATPEFAIYRLTPSSK